MSASFCCRRYLVLTSLLVALFQCAPTAYAISGFIQPFSLVSDVAGRWNDDAVFVADAGNHRIISFSARTDAVTGQFALPNSFVANSVAGIAVSGTAANRIVAAAFPQYNQVNVYAANGTLIASTSAPSPSGVAFDADGFLYVVDSTGSSGVTKMSVSGVVQRRFNTSPVMAAPTRVFVDDFGFVYVIAAGNNNVVSFTSAGSVQRIYGSASATPSPRGVAVDPYGNVFISLTSGRVIKYSNAGSQLGTFIISSSALSGVTIDNFGRLVIAIPTTGQLARIDSTSGQGLSSLAASPNAVIAVRRMSMSMSGVLYYVDTGTSPRTFYQMNVNGTGFVARVFTPTTNGIAIDSTNNAIVISNTDRRTEKHANPSGALLSQSAVLNEDIVSLAVDRSGIVYVCGVTAIFKLNAQLSTFQRLTTSSPALLSPQGVAVDVNNNIVIADTFNNRVVAMTASGAVTWTSRVMSPYGIAVHSSGNIFVSSVNSIVVLSSTGALLQNISTPASSNDNYALTIDETKQVVYVSQYNRIWFTSIPDASPAVPSSSTGIMMSSSSSSAGVSNNSCVTSARVGSYDLSSLANSDQIGISINKDYQYFLRLCGTVSTSFCTEYAPGSSLCQLTIPPLSGRVVAAANSGSLSAPMEWLYIKGNPQLGVVGLIQNGYECGRLSLPAQMILQINCDPNAQNLTVFTVDDSTVGPTYATCVYQVTINSALSCPKSTVASEQTSQTTSQSVKNLAQILSNVATSDADWFRRWFRSQNQADNQIQADTTIATAAE